MVNVGASGTARVLFPNQLQPNNLVQAGQTVVVPGLLTELAIPAEAPGGQERVIAACSPGRRELPATVAAGPFRVITDAALVRELAAGPTAGRGLPPLPPPPADSPAAAPVAPAAAPPAAEASAQAVLSYTVTP